MQLDMLATDPNHDLIGFTFAGAASTFEVTGTAAQPTYVNVTETLASGKQLATCRPVQMIRALRSERA